MPILLRLIRASITYKTTLLLSFSCGAMFAVARYLRAYLAQPLVDDILVPAASMGVEESIELFQAPLLEIGLIAGVTIVVSPLAALGRGYFAAKVVAQVRRDFNQQLARKFLRIPLGTLRSRSSGDFLARALSDVVLACEAINKLFADVAMSLIMIVMSLVALFATSPTLALFSLVSMPLLALVLRFFGRRILRHTYRRQETVGDLSRRLTGILAGVKVIKAFRGFDSEEQAFGREADRFFKRHMKIVWNREMSRSSTEGLTQLAAFFTLGAGGWFTLSGQFGLTLGTLTAFSAILVSTYKPVKSVAGSYSRIMEFLAGASRLFELLDEPEEGEDRDGARTMEPIREGIELRGVHFAFGEAPVLNGVDLKIDRGEVVALVGKTGAGKSTLLDLILRFYDPSRGSIEIDGVDLRDLTRESFLDHVAVVSQEPFLFDGSILENICYGRPEATSAEAEQAAVAAGAAEFISELPDGYETAVGEFGLGLSGGQRQRVTIARAILRQADLLVLDEPTSALDPKTEKAVQDTIAALRGRQTILIVSHSLSVIRGADRIVVMDGGRVAATGSHERLVAESSVYRELVQVEADATAP